MTNFISRNYAGAGDRQLILDFLVAVRPAGRISDYPSPVDLHELLALRKVRANTRLWFDGEQQMAGFAFVDSYANLSFEILSRAGEAEIAAEMVAWGEACLRRTRRRKDEPLSLDASCRDDDLARIEILERHGFVRQSGFSVQMRRSLNLAIPEVRLPEGFSIRSVSGEEEVEALVELHRAAFGTEHMTIEERLAMMRIPVYDPGLDLVAVAPDGRLAAYCMCLISEAENQRSGRKDGYTDPVATHPDFQGKGLAKALLLCGMRLLKERGMDTACLGTSSENIAMQRAAEAVGFKVKSRMIWFSKAL